MTEVSAIVPVYNGERYIASTIDSALAQRFDGKSEVIVTDDGSTDSTPQILKAYGKRIRVVTQSNRGAAAARNAAVAASTGDYLAFLDGDDLWTPDYLAKMSAALDANARAALAFCGCVIIDEECRIYAIVSAGRAPTMQDLLRRGWEIPTSGTLMRRSAFNECGGFSEEFPRQGFEDNYMWLCARERGEFAYVAEPLVVYRMSPGMDKYETNRRTFIRLLRSRYGRGAAELIDFTNSQLARHFFVKALQRIDARDPRGAVRAVTRALRLKPSYVLRPAPVARAFRRKNLARLAAALSPLRSRA